MAELSIPAMRKYLLILASLGRIITAIPVSIDNNTITVLPEGVQITAIPIFCALQLIGLTSPYSS
jgi:hypothetical protein